MFALPLPGNNPLQELLNMVTHNILTSDTCHCNSVDNMVCDHPTWDEVKEVCLTMDDYISIELKQHSSNRAWFGRFLYRNHLLSTRAECRTYASRLIRARRAMQWSSLHVMLEQEYARANVFQQANPSDDTFASAGITFMHTHINTTLYWIDLMLIITLFRYNICRWPTHCIFIFGCIRPDHSPSRLSTMERSRPDWCALGTYATQSGYTQIPIRITVVTFCTYSACVVYLLEVQDSNRTGDKIPF